VNKFLALSFQKQATNEGCSAIRAEVPMCDKCVELDGKIEHYRKIASLMTDQQTIDGLQALIERMEAQKVAFHPDQQK
jgi:hypothetical protein